MGGKREEGEGRGKRYHTSAWKDAGCKFIIHYYQYIIWWWYADDESTNLKIINYDDVIDRKGKLHHTQGRKKHLLNRTRVSYDDKNQIVIEQNGIHG